MKRTKSKLFALLIGLLAAVAVSEANAQKILYGNNAGFGPDVVNKIDLNTGANVQSYTPSGGNGRGVVVVGNIMYSTAVGDPHIYKTDATTGASLGSILTDQASLSTLAWDGSAFWTTDYSGTKNGFKIDITGHTIKTVTFSLASGDMDGMEYFNGKLIVNRYDDGTGPGGINYYDIYDLDGNVLVPAFITVSDGTGIAYDGVNFLVSRVHANAIDTFDGTTGAFISEKILTGSHLIEDLSIDYSQRPDTANIQLNPLSATNELGATHTICATIVVVTNGVTNIVVGTTVNFSITNGPNVGLTHSSVTDSNGTACFSYIGTNGVGTDFIEVSFLDSHTNRFASTATKVWVQPSNLPPTANCKGTVIVSADSLTCQASVTANDVDNGSFDPDSGDSITNKTLIPPGPYPLGSNTVTLVVTDSHGATNSCTATVVVQDTTPPTMNCPSNIVQNTDPGQCSAVVNYTVTASDYCSGGAAVNVNVYSGHDVNGGGAPYSGLVGSFAANGVTFGTDTGFNWHPFGLDAFGADITGCLNVSADGVYSFDLTSDDGSLLFIDGNLVVDNGGGHSPILASGTASLTAGLHTFEVQFFEDFGGPSGVDLGLPAGVNYASCGLPVTCNPPSGSTFPKGTTTVVCCSVDGAGNTNCCSFDVTVQDKEPPLAACRPAVNPGAKKIPTAGKNPKSGQNTDGYYQLLGTDNCDPNPGCYVQDSITGFVFGPFASGTIVKIVQSNHDLIQPLSPPVVPWQIQVVGDALVYAVDADGNVGVSVSCLVPKPPK